MSVALVNKEHMDKVILYFVNYFKTDDKLLQICYYNLKEIKIIREILNITYLLS